MKINCGQPEDLDEVLRLCPHCKKGMMHVLWLQYDNPPEPMPLTLQRIKLGCSYCAHREIWKVVEKPRPYIEQRKSMRRVQ